MFGAEQGPRSRALDAWDYRAPFAGFHIAWGPGEGAKPAFEGSQAYGIAVQELGLDRQLEVLARREVLVTFSSEHVQVGGAPAAGEPAWVVIVVGRKRPGADAGYLNAVAPGGGAVVQCLIGARTGDVLLGTAVPVNVR